MGRRGPGALLLGHPRAARRARRRRDLPAAPRPQRAAALRRLLPEGAPAPAAVQGPPRPRPLGDLRLLPLRRRPPLRTRGRRVLPLPLPVREAPVEKRDRRRRAPHGERRVRHAQARGLVPKCRRSDGGGGVGRGGVDLRSAVVEGDGRLVARRAPRDGVASLRAREVRRFRALGAPRRHGPAARRRASLTKRAAARLRDERDGRPRR